MEELSAHDMGLIEADISNRREGTNAGVWVGIMGKFKKAFFWMLLCSQGNMKQHHQLSLKIRGDMGILRQEKI